MRSENATSACAARALGQLHLQMRIGHLLWTQCPPVGPHHTKQSVSVEHCGSILQATGVKSSVAGATPGLGSGALTRTPSGVTPVVLAIAAAMPTAVTNSSPIHTK